MSISEIRRSYSGSALDETSVSPDPLTQFQTWMDDARKADLLDPTAMTLATATPQGKPSARIVLLKAVSERGFVFYTNTRSRKGVELAANPEAVLVFYWDCLSRQVRVEGAVEAVSSQQSEAYFHSRPIVSQLAAAASRQSEVIESRQALEDQMRKMTERYKNAVVPRPNDWGGYRVMPRTIEFWQGRKERLHDRLRYTRLPEGSWRIERLAP